MHVKKKILKSAALRLVVKHSSYLIKNGGKKHANEEFQAIDINL